MQQITAEPYLRPVTLGEYLWAASALHIGERSALDQVTRIGRMFPAIREPFTLPAPIIGCGDDRDLASLTRHLSWSADYSTGMEMIAQTIRSISDAVAQEQSANGGVQPATYQAAHGLATRLIREYMDTISPRKVLSPGNTTADCKQLSILAVAYKRNAHYPARFLPATKNHLVFQELQNGTWISKDPQDILAGVFESCETGFTPSSAYDCTYTKMIEELTHPSFE